MGDLNSLSRDQLVAFVAFQQQNQGQAMGTQAQPPRRQPARSNRRGAQPVNPLDEIIPDCYKSFYDLPLKIIRQVLIHTTKCDQLNEINVGSYTLEDAFYILWNAFSIYTHAKIPRTMSNSVGHLVQEVKKCYVAKRTFTCC